uniref:Scaffolding protein n=1 Tax=viral metagenome TaxID=1070528 RepID=A0A6M3IPD3_9ZZZZ
MGTKLEGATAPEAEVVKTTQGTEEEKQTEPKEESTVERTYTQKELDKALGKGLESINRQLSEKNKALAAKEAELEETRKTSTRKLEDLQGELEDIRDEHQQAIKALDDDDVKKSYTDRATLRKREREAARREKDAEDKLSKAETLVYKQGLEAKAKLLHEETGIPVKELVECETESEMEVKALRYQLTHPTGEKAKDDGEDKSPKFDSGLSSGKADLSGLSQEDRLARALAKMDKGK